MSILNELREASEGKREDMGHIIEENEEVQIEEPKKFSIDEFISKNREGCISNGIGLGLEDFNLILKFEMFSLSKNGRGRREFAEKESFFLFLSWVASGMTFAKLSILFGLFKSKIPVTATTVLRMIK